MVLREKKRKVDKTEMNIVDYSVVNRRRMRSSTESQRRRVHISFIPDDVVFSILLFLPVDVIYDVMRCVCRQWYNLIQSPVFISFHLQNSTTKCLLIEKSRGITGGTIGYIVKPMLESESCCDVEVNELKLPFANKVRGSCNGLVFVIGRQDRKYKLPTYVANPVTKQHLALPHFPVGLTKDSWCFAYAAASKVYKVVTYQESKCFILSVGVDMAWRQVDISHLTSDTRELLEDSCLSLRGFLYWVDGLVPYILRFDMETETFGQIPLPPQCTPQIPNSMSHHYGLVAMESSLCLWAKKYLFAMKDPESGDGQWEKLPDIEKLLNGHGISRIYPLGWLRSKELFVFYTMEGTIVYNVNTGDLKPLKELKMRGYFVAHAHAHVNSLVALPNYPQKIAPRLNLRSTRSNPGNLENTIIKL